MGASLHHLEEKLFRRSCNTLLLETDAYADVRAHHCHCRINSTMGDSLAAERWLFSLGSCEIKGNLGCLEDRVAAFLNKEFYKKNLFGVQLQTSGWSKTKLVRSKRLKYWKMFRACSKVPIEADLRSRLWLLVPNMIHFSFTLRTVFYIILLFQLLNLENMIDLSLLHITLGYSY